MTQQFEDFVNAALDKSLASDVTLPTANKIPVYTGIGRQVTAKTAAELDIAIKSDVDTALSSKEPTITAGTSSQYYRGDKTFQPLNTNAVTESTDKRYLSDAQKTIATQAATSTLSGYLSSTDWSTFNGKQAALTDVVTADTYGSSTQWPKVTVNTKGIVTGIELQTVPTPTLTDATFSVQKNGSPSIAASWDLTALTASHVHTYPNKDINFGDLPSVATNDDNSIALEALRCRILGGNNNTVSGTNNVAIGCTYTHLNDTSVVAIGCANFNASGAAYTSCTFIGSNPALMPATKSIMLGMRNSYMQTDPVTGSLFLGASDNPDLSTYPVAACTVNNSLFASDSVPVSGTLYATTDGSQTLSSANCLPIPINSGTAQYEVDFIVTVGAVGSASTACNATGCISMRRIFTVFKNSPGTAASISAIDTVGTDRTLGAIGGTFTPTIALSGTTHVTVGITRASGDAGQEAMAISCRVRAHLTR